MGLTETISSPTFVLMNEYRSGPYPIIHVDLYRLGEERANSLSDELFSLIDEGRSLVLVEWACYGAFLDEAISVSIQIDMQPEAGAETRIIELSANRPLWKGCTTAEGPTS
jgi:tRNA A37 threonylcarbamoyladenosine biosynthesis protein TsaE